MKNKKGRRAKDLKMPHSVKVLICLLSSFNSDELSLKNHLKNGIFPFFTETSGLTIYIFSRPQPYLCNPLVLLLLEPIKRLKRSDESC